MVCTRVCACVFLSDRTILLRTPVMHGHERTHTIQKMPTSNSTVAGSVTGRILLAFLAVRARRESIAAPRPIAAEQSAVGLTDWGALQLRRPNEICDFLTTFPYFSLKTFIKSSVISGNTRVCLTHEKLLNKF